MSKSEAEFPAKAQYNFPLTVGWPWKTVTKLNKTLFSKTHIPKPLATFCSLSFHQPSSPPQDASSTKHTTLLVETYYEHQSLRALLHKLNKKGSLPLRILRDDGDWSKDHFWTVIKFLKRSTRCNEILQVFDVWKEKEKSRINELNYEKIIELLGEDGLMEEAVSAFVEMKSYGLTPSLRMYNSLIHGFARDGKFDCLFFYLNEMKEMNLAPESDTYDGLIKAYGKYEMYDELGMCLKRMEIDGCSPDQVTYNLLITEFARGGLLSRMEKVYHAMRSKKLDLQSSTQIAMLDAYVNFGILEKMEKMLKSVRHSKASLDEELVRKIAGVYIENYMFSRLNDLADDLASQTGRSAIIWCLRLLSHACLLSRKGMDSVIKEMEEARVSWSVTVANIVLLTYLKVKDFTHMRILLSRLSSYRVKPDIVTIGVLFDANSMGFDGARTLETWKRMGLLHKSAELNTDPLVLAAFGKVQFLRNCEEMYSSLQPKDRNNKRWTYYDLIHLVTKHNEQHP
ncbi:hypothetical protein K2173_011627 [Erythroxylum novogranatense]|uniref:Pentatricopeptide repeat-containing protein n=1 Tax=Erythroxylum novogranatense TaxID=1862640 RepID=A0AAV8U969_9ROSI|nr:hypothetical protein K2173_011627 [Erythroxylum novogranatense]